MKLPIIYGICVAGLFVTLPSLRGLNPRKSFTQYTRTTWTQAQGLPQDSVSAIAQTQDGYLWLGTSEGLGRFDGYEFVTYTESQDHLPSNSILSLLAARDGTLWIGTNNGFASYKDGQFRNYGKADGFTNQAVTSLAEDEDGTLWSVGAGGLRHITSGKASIVPMKSVPLIAIPRRVQQDRDHHIWLSGPGGLVKKTKDGFTPVLRADQAGDGQITVTRNTKDALWVGTTAGLIRLTHDGVVKRYSTNDGLPNAHIRSLLQDHDGNLWVGTLSGLSRLENGRFVGLPDSDHEERGTVWALLEDRERNLWVGSQASLTRFRDDPFTMFGKPEGLPSNEPMAIHEDKAGQLWFAYRDSGLLRFQPGKPLAITTRDGLPSHEIYRISDGANGDLLIAGSGGLSRWSQGKIINYTIPSATGNAAVNDALVDAHGQLWAAAAGGIYRLDDGVWTRAIPVAAAGFRNWIILREAPDHSIWASTSQGGLWRIDGQNIREFKAKEGLASDQIRSLTWDSEGTLWIGAFDGGLTRYRDGMFRNFGARDGLLSDNISHVDDDQLGYLWLSTTKGLCRVSKQQLDALATGRIQRLTPANYGIPHGLRSTHLAQLFPTGGGGTRTRDGRLWFTSVNGVVMVNPKTDLDRNRQDLAQPITHMTTISVDGHPLTSTSVEPGPRRIELRYTALYLSAPEAVQYSYKLEGLDPDWVAVAGRRGVTYNNLAPGSYRFVVKAEVPSRGASQTEFAFTVLPHFYETTAFLFLGSIGVMGAIYSAYRLRLAQVAARYGILLRERARLAREIHDTLAQGFVGISHQLDALAGKLPTDSPIAQEHLDLARKMTRHSLTEARRSIMDLRLSELEDQKLPQALSIAAPRWVAGTGMRVSLDVGEVDDLTPDVEQSLFRIAQEAAANIVKHARGSMLSLRLKREAGCVLLAVSDDGVGFDTSDSFQSLAGHFGIMGMRERAERYGGTLLISSQTGVGTCVEARIPCARNRTPKKN